MLALQMVRSSADRSRAERRWRAFYYLRLWSLGLGVCKVCVNGKGYLRIAFEL